MFVFGGEQENGPEFARNGKIPPECNKDLDKDRKMVTRTTVSTFMVR